MKLFVFLLAATLFEGLFFKPFFPPPPEPPPVVVEPPPLPKTDDIRLIRFRMKIDDPAAATLEAAFTAVKATGQKYLVIEINSPGGYVSSGFRMVKMIEELGVKVYCVVDGEADSMAFYLLQGCHARYMTKRSKLMMHEPSIEVTSGGDRLFFKKLAATLDAETRAMNEFYMEKMGISLAEIEKRTVGQDWWMNWKEALQYHAIDGTARSVEEIIRKAQAENP